MTWLVEPLSGLKLMSDRTLIAADNCTGEGVLNNCSCFFGLKRCDCNGGLVVEI